MKDSDENINACGGSLTPNMTDDNVDVVATGEAGEVDAKEEMDAKETTFTMKPEDRSSGENGDANNPAKRVGSASEAFEHILFQVGSYGKWQWKIFFIVSFCGIFTAFHNLSAAFIAATPEHWCHVAALDTLDGSHDLRNGSVPWKVGWEGKGEFSSCTYYNRNWTGLVAGGLTGDDLPFLPTSDVPIQGCHDWVYDHAIYETTAVEEWDLVCLNKYRMSFIQSTYMGGVLAGALVLSELADKFGRRTISLVSAVGFLVASVSVAFVTPYPLFLIFRFFVAAFGSGIFLSNFVIIMETVGSEGRTVMGMMYQCFFAVGFMLLPAIAYFVNDWRSLQLWISIPSVLMLLYYWFLPESPRWLMLQGRYEDALKILRQVAKTNGGSLPPKEELDVLCDSVEEERLQGVKTVEGVLQKVCNFFRSIIILLSTPNLRRRCLIIFFAWFVVSMVYYGLTFSGGNINASPYLLVFLSGLVEIPSYILSCWTLKKFGRRLNLCALFIICGISCLLILLVPKEMVWVNLSLATVGKFFNSSAFGVAYIYSAELVPTGVRNTAMGTSSMCARIGSGLAPFIVDLLGDLHYAVPSTVFGLLSVVAGLLALLLPETGNTHLPETVADVEALAR
ncbi:Organic cation transporter protein [Chionoecetes opilio]|uniref:Organic cation transporter protein n=1 Tax=Chionoecetes opilio TaxID=41210 RepID=A0A8J4YBR6_CHIOP|nr:Organic cation transporter protein [Chionoecetes opilio]